MRTMLDARVNYQTGKVSKIDPLTTLAKYKKWKNIEGTTDVIFGEHMLPQGNGLISVGDKLEIISRRDPPLEYGSGLTNA